MSTRKLFYEDSHRKTFSARVLSCEQVSGGWEVRLDATCFYPEGGGQAADTGRLGNADVLHTREEGDEILHLCSLPLEPGSMVAGTIDYEKRFLRMQQHSGEHMVSGIIHRRYGWHNTGFHMSSSDITIDFDGVVPAEDLMQIELEANRAVWANLPVKTWIPSPQELSAIPYRTKRALPWPVRIVEYPGIDICACCGTHVQFTGEIGIIKLYSAVPCRGGTRIVMACGSAAYDMLCRIYNENRRVSQLLSAQITQTGDAAGQLLEQLSMLKGSVIGLQREKFAGIAAGCRAMGDTLYITSGLDSNAVRELADKIADVCGGTAAVFSGDGTAFRCCLVSRQDDLRSFGKAMNAALSGRGGGKPGFHQGSVSAGTDEITAFFRTAGFRSPTR